MKRLGNLFEKIIDWKNIVSAAKTAGQGKPPTTEKLIFEYNLEGELVKLRKELESKIYRPGPYKVFYINDPKRRLISAAPFRDRVVHHCICNVIEPVFDRSFLPQNYANRKGRGLHLALKAAKRIVNTSPYLLKGDIKKYFPSIDHQILKGLICSKIKCQDTLELIDLIIDASNQQEPANFYFPGDNLFTPFERRKGLPIGNLTSQLFANIYLNRLDYFIVRTLKIHSYVRYVDDFLIGGESKKGLHAAAAAIEHCLEKLRLVLHTRKTVIFPAKRGFTYLGFRLYPGKVLAGKRCGKRFKRRMGLLQKEYSEGKVSLKKIKNVIASYNGHLKHGATARLRAKILADHPFVNRRITC